MKLSLLFVLFAGFVCFASCLSFKESSEWKLYKSQHNKTYKNGFEEHKRLNTWLKRSKTVAEHNKKYVQGKVSYKMAINKFSDMTPEELQNLYTGLKLEKPKEDQKFVKKVVFKPTGPIADEKDWRSEGAVTDVKDQGQCGSCYSFSVTGTLEGQHKLQVGSLVSFSEQQIVDCAKGYGGTNGCHGGNMNGCYQYIMDAGGIDTEDSYGYNADDSEDCYFNQDNVGATISGFDSIDEGEDNLLNAVASVGPISIGIYVADSMFQYGGGVYDEPYCDGTINHAVLAVGYGNEDGNDYWLVKNSWGAGWGDGGYVKMSRNKDNQCSIATWATVPDGVQSKKPGKKAATKTTTKAHPAVKYFMNLMMSIGGKTRK